MKSKKTAKISLAGVGQFILEVLFIFASLVFLMTKQAKLYGADIMRFSKGYIGWYILYWGIVVVAIVLFINLLRYFFIDRPIKKLSLAARQVASGNFSIRLEHYPMSTEKGYINVLFRDFNTMMEELSSTEILKNDFISNISHEIRTPLAVIQNYATLLQDESLSLQQRREYSDTVFQASEQLAAFVTNVLRLSKLENQSILPIPSPYNVCRQLSDCVMGFSDRLEEKEIEFSADIEDSALVAADESMMEIVWNNLLSNAIKFTECGGRIILREYTDRDCVIVSIEDNGCGMDGKTIKHIFEKFYQGDTPHSKEGYGLGLALTAKIVGLCDGDIRVASEPGKGSVFYVQLKKPMLERSAG